MKKLSIVVAFCALLAGCMSITNNKHLTIAPSKEPVLVTATSQARCYDLFLIMFCRLNMAIEASNGQKISDFSR